MREWRSSSDVHLAGVFLERAIYGLQQVQNPPSPSPKPGSSPNPVDSFHLSPAALAHLQGGGDANHDGDSK
jgi:hypothetical protein